MNATSSSLLIVCVTAVLLQVSLTSAGQPLTNSGTQFVVGGYQKLLEVGSELYISTTEDRIVSYSIFNGSNMAFGSVSSSESMSVNLQSIFEKSKNGVLISSIDGVSKLTVVGRLNLHNGVSADTFTVYPVHEYGSYSYFAVSTERSGIQYQSMVHLVGTRSSTRVTITPTQELPSLAEYGCTGSTGEDCIITLNHLQTLILRSMSDLTGTKIVSNYPISVFSGHECAYIPSELTTVNCKLVFEQIPPVVTWGKSFLVGPLMGHNTGELYKVVAANANTNVDVCCIGSGVTYSDSFQLNSEGSSQTFTVGQSRRCSIRGDKPILVMLFAPNEVTGRLEPEGGFMALVPPVKQYTSTHTLNLQPYSNNTVTITIPASACPNSQCIIEIDNQATIDIAISSEPIYCSPNEVCGYVVTETLPAGVHTVSLAESTGAMGVISYTYRRGTYGTGTVGGLALNHIAVEEPEVVVGYSGKLIVGNRLVLTCTVTFQEGLGNGIKIFPQFLRGDTGVEVKTVSPIDTQRSENGPYILNHTFEALSTEDSDVYKCEVRVRSDHAGLLATASGSMSLTIVGYGYIQLQLVGVPKCSEWQLTESENRVDELTEEVSNVISKTCNCDFSQSYISMPTLQCAPVNPDISNILLYQARVQEGGGSPLNYRHLVTVLEATANTSFRYKAILLTVGSSEGCVVAIESLQASPGCFPVAQSPTTDPPSTGGVASGSDSKNGIIVAGVVGTCVVVLVLGLAVILVCVFKGRHSSISPQRPKSIHLHHRLPHGGDSVTSFSPGSGSSGSNIYVQKDSTPSSPTTNSSFPIPHNGIRNGTYSPPLSDKEQELNYKTMKANLSEVELLPTITHV